MSLREICLGGPDAASQVAGIGVSDMETEQLLSEIELLTSRALQETNQAGTDATRKLLILLFQLDKILIWT